MFHPSSHLNKHGFFEVGPDKFYSKLDAITHSVNSGHSVVWNFNNEVFSKQNWKQEPNIDIQDLYRQRAQDLRDRYDYIVVMFSGGADSTTVLDSFFNNGIHVDEVLVNLWAKYQPQGIESFMNAEITHAALPYLKNRAPNNTKIRIDDISDIQLSCVKDAGFRKRSYREVNNVHNPGSVGMHYNLHLRHQDYIDLYEQGKSIAFVWGEAKPKIDYDEVEQKHFFWFEDHYAHAPQPREQEANDSRCNHEQFFDDPAYPEIKLKQCHLLLKNLKQISHRGDIFLPLDEAFSKQKGPRGFEITNPRSSMAITQWQGKKYCLDRNAFNCSIYPGWNFLTYHEDKQAGRVAHPSHRWLEDIAGAEVRDWFRGYLEIYGKLPDEWTKYYGSLAKGIKRLQIKYYLE